MECGLILLITCIIAGGTLGALLRGWGLVVRILRLETAVQDLHGTVKVEVKKRAAEARFSKADRDAIELANLRPQAQAVKEPWEY